MSLLPCLTFFRGRGALVALPLALSAVWPLQAHALFGDDEARRAIIELRQKVDANQQTTDAAMKALEAKNADSDTATRRSMLELSNQIEQLRGEMARLLGQYEQLARDVSEIQRQQKDTQVGID
jgi:predicted nuclease with TOPRIM domain